MWKTSTIDEICNVEYGTRVVRRKDSGTVYPVAPYTLSLSAWRGRAS